MTVLPGCLHAESTSWMHIESVHENGSVLDVGEQNQLVITESPTGKILTIRPKALKYLFQE